jgi:hypothetical protein
VGSCLALIIHDQINHYPDVLLPIPHHIRFTDSYWNDYKFYVLNNHLILSIFCGHPENPYSGCPRLLAVISSNFYAIFLAICLTYEPSESKRMIFEYTLVVVLQCKSSHLTIHPQRYQILITVTAAPSPPPPQPSTTWRCSTFRPAHACTDKASRRSSA